MTATGWNGVSNGPSRSAAMETDATAGTSIMATTEVARPTGRSAALAGVHNDTRTAPTITVPAVSTAGSSHPGRPVPVAGRSQAAYVAAPARLPQPYPGPDRRAPPPGQAPGPDEPGDGWESAAV